MATGAKPYSTFVAGLITEAGPLTFPENASHDELNCILFRKGNRRRRLGVDYENSFALSTATITEAQARDNAVNTYVWTAVGGDGTRNFLIIQLDTTLHYYDLSIDPLSTGKKSFTTDLSKYAASGATNIGTELITIASGRGLVFISSKKIEPISIEYDSDSDTISEKQINIKIRDFEGLPYSKELVPGSTGTAIGNMTSGGNLAASFDGSVNANAASSKVTGTTAYIGKDWGAGNTKTITKFVLKSPSDSPFFNTSLIVALEGSTDNFSSSTVTLYTGAAFTNNTNGIILTIDSGIDVSAAYRYVRVKILAGSSVALAVAELEFYEDATEIYQPDFEPTTLGTTHSYNLKNQGWNAPGTGEDDPTVTYQTSKSVYPSNSKQWWVAKNDEEVFQPDLLVKFSGGNTLAPRGHWLLNPFFQDRSTASGVSGITVVSETNRAQFVNFFSGRVWYFGVDSGNINGNVFFSQVLTDVERAGKCYQEGDPTSEVNNELVDDDGGVIVIPEIGAIMGSIVIDRYLVIFANNGVWSISGASEDGFKATDFQVTQVTTVGCNSTGSIIEVESKPYWWSETGIYTIAPDQISGRLAAQSLTQNTIETFYQDEIPAVSKTFVRSVYDSATKRVYWFYNTVAPTSGNQYTSNFNAALVFDSSLGSFYPWKISSLDSNTPYIAGVFNTRSVNTVDNTELVADGDGDLVIDASSNSVVVDVSTISGSNTFLKWFFLVPTGSSTYNWTFGLFNNGDYVDWETKDGVGKTYDSFVQTGFEIAGDFVKKKTPPYIYVYFDKSETATAGGALVNPSSCFLTTKFDWTESGDTGKWSTRRQIYRLKRYFDSSIITTHLPGETLVVAKEKVRGRGRAIQFRFESESGKDFNIHGWQAVYNIQEGL